MRQESLKQILFREDVPTDVKDVIKEYLQDTDSTEKLVEDNEILSTVLETSPVGIGLLTGPILGWTNDALAQMIGYKSDFLSGKKIRILFPNEEEFERVIKELLDVPEKIRILKAETTWLHQDGSMINVLLHARLIDISDAGKGVIVTAMDITERKNAEEVLQQRTHDLDARVKELNCLHGIYKLIKDVGRPLDVIFSEILRLLPHAWQYPENICARITFKGKEFTIDNFQESCWVQAADIVVSGEKIGAVEVYYLGEMPEIDQGSFLKEERTLIDNIGQIIGNLIVRKKTLSDLQDNESMLQKSQEIGRVGSFEMDLKTSDVRWSNQLYKLFSMKKSGSLVDYEKVLSLIHPDDRERAITVSSDAAREGKAYELEHRVIHPDGTILNLMIRGDVIHNDKKEPAKIVGTVQDITERKQVEEALRASEEKYRTILESIEDGYYEVDLAGNFTFINNSLSRILGYSINELIGMNNRQYMDKETSKKVYEVFNTVYQKGQPTKIFGYEAFRKDGTKRFIEVSVSLIIDSNGEPTGFRGILRDITERKQIEEEIRESEKKYQMLIEKLEEGVILEDADGLITFVNPRAMKRIGYSEEELIGKHWSFTSPPEDLEKYQTETDKRPDGISSTYESGILSKSGKRIPIIVSATPIFSSEGAYEGTLSVFRDISEIKRAEEALLESEQRLREVTENMIDMVSISNMETIIQYASPSHKLILGYEPENLEGKSIIDFLHKDDLNEVLAKIQEGLETLSPKETQIRYRCANGDYKWIETMGKFILDDEGNPFRMIFSSRDITERKKAEEELGKTKARLEYLLVSSPAIIYSAEPKGDNQTTFMSENVSDILGHKAQNFMYNPNFWVGGLHPEDRQYAKTAFSEIFEKGYYSETYRFQHKNGTYRWMLEESKLIRDKHGKPFEIIGYWIDITDRKQAEEDLRRSEIHYRKLFEESPVSLWEEDFSQVISYLESLKESGVKDFRKYFEEHQEDVAKCTSLAKILDVNQATLDMYKAKSKDELIENLDRVFVEESYDTFREELIALAEGATKFSIETVGQNLKGEKIYAHLGLSISTGYGDPSSRVLISILDVTDRRKAEELLRESEEKYRNLFNSSPDLIILIDPDSRIIDCNSAVENFVNMSKDDIIGHHFSEMRFIREEDLPSYIEQMSELIDGSGPRRTDIELIDNSGRSWYFEAILKIWKKNDDIAAVQVLLHDITERKLIERARLELDNRRRKFIETTSHELRTPITSIKGFMEMLQIHGDTFSQGRKEEIFEVINKNIDRLIRLIEDVSDVAKIDREFFRLDKQRINFYNFFNDEMTEYKKLLGNHLEFQCHLESDLMMDFDKNRVHQVLDNVISNAIKQTIENTRKIVINAKELLNNMIRIEISDNGAGIDSQNLERIFEPFVSIASEYSVRGTGIGLYLCRIIVERHGGTIKAHSDGLGRGATFTIDLPIGS